MDTRTQIARIMNLNPNGAIGRRMLDRIVVQPVVIITAYRRTTIGFTAR